MAERRGGPVRPPIIAGEARAIGGAPATVAGGPDAVAPESGTGSEIVSGTDSEIVSETGPVEWGTGAAAADGEARPADTGPFEGGAIDTGPAGTAPADLRPSPEPHSGFDPTPNATTSPATARRPEPRGRSFPVLLSALLGALLGAALVYGLASWGYLPEAPATEDGSVAALEARLDALESAAPAGLPADLEARIAALETRPGSPVEAEALAPLEARLAALETRPAPAADLEPLRTELTNLAGRVEALAAGGPGADAEALGADLAALRDRVGAVSARVEQLAGQQARSDEQVAALRSDWDAAEAEAAAAAAAAPEVDPAMEARQLADSLRAALAGGGGFGAELGAVRAALPALDPPGPALIERVDAGLGSHAELAGRLRAAVPAMLAARPVDPDAGLLGGALDWLRASLAVRETGEPEGDTPEALVSRLEAAIDREEYSAAADLLAQLPEPMRAAAGSLPADLAARLEAQAFMGRVEATVAGLAEAAP